MLFREGVTTTFCGAESDRGSRGPDASVGAHQEPLRAQRKRKNGSFLLNGNPLNSGQRSLLRIAFGNSCGLMSLECDDLRFPKVVFFLPFVPLVVLRAPCDLFHELGDTKPYKSGLDSPHDQYTFAFEY